MLMLAFLFIKMYPRDKHNYLHMYTYTYTCTTALSIIAKNRKQLKCLITGNILKIKLHPLKNVTAIRYSNSKTIYLWEIIHYQVKKQDTQLYIQLILILHSHICVFM